MSQPCLVFASSLDYARHTGGYVYNSRLMQALGARGWEVATLDLPAGFPRPDGAARARSAALLEGLPDGALLVADQICLSPLAEIVRREGTRLRLVMIFHHPMAEEELPPDARVPIMAAEISALTACCLVIATSQTTADTLAADYGVSPERIVVAPPGIARFAAPISLPISLPGPGPVEALHLLTVGAVIPRKGYHVLVEALAGLADLPWTISIVGDHERAPDYVAALQAQVSHAGLGTRVSFRGGIAAPALDAAWQSAHVYVAASLHEGYGMAVAEAIARGLPTVTTGAGAIRGWLDPGAALIIPERAPEALRTALRRVIAEPALRAGLRTAALAQAARFPTWTEAAASVDGRLAAL